MNGNYISGVRLSSPIDQGSYLYNLPAVRQLAKLKELSFNRPVTFKRSYSKDGFFLIRIVTKLGFNGYKEFKHALIYELVLQQKQGGRSLLRERSPCFFSAT